MSDWISVKDRMPEEHNGWSTDVLVVWDWERTGGRKLVGINRTNFVTWVKGDPDVITHWMPLPEPPEDMVHGVNCEKSAHTGDGYMHGEDDDSPYDVDGVMYCGRCHRALPQGDTT